MLQVQKLGVAVLEHPSMSHIRLGGSPLTGAALLNVAAAVASGALTELALTSSEVNHSLSCYSLYTLTTLCSCGMHCRAVALLMQHAYACARVCWRTLA
jgi:hypothetical protein